MKRTLSIVLLAALFGLVGCKEQGKTEADPAKAAAGEKAEKKAEAKKNKFPARDITNIVVWSAGGGTDVVNRKISAEMSKALGVNIVVQNSPGGVAGSLGMSQALKRPKDGYTLVGLAGAEASAAVQGGWNERFTVWYPYIVGGSPSVVSVKGDSKYNKLEDLIEDAKKNSGKIKAAASGSGSPHHLNLLALEKGTGAKFNYIPYKGSAPSQTAVMTGEVTVVVTTVAEQIQLLKGKKLKPLAVLVENPMEVEGVGKIPSALAALPQLKEHLPIMQAIGFSVHKDTPEDVRKALGAAFEKAMKSKEITDWAKQNYYQLSGQWGEKAQKEYARLESLFSWTLHELGNTKVDPTKLSIPKP